jgi:hypothetical protein
MKSILSLVFLGGVFAFGVSTWIGVLQTSSRAPASIASLGLNAQDEKHLRLYGLPGAASVRNLGKATGPIHLTILSPDSSADLNSRGPASGSLHLTATIQVDRPISAVHFGWATNDGSKLITGESESLLQDLVPGQKYTVNADVSVNRAQNAQVFLHAYEVKRGGQRIGTVVQYNINEQEKTESRATNRMLKVQAHESSPTTHLRIFE